MNTRSLKIISQLKHQNQSSLAQMAHVTRQAVSQWMKKANHPNPDVDILTSHLRGIAQGLDVTADDLLNSFPLLGDIQETRRHETLFLWDHLYPSLFDFCIALIHKEEAALARLVEVYGLFRASKVAGPVVWKKFENYKSRIRPIRRKQLEAVWQAQQNLA